MPADNGQIIVDAEVTESSFVQEYDNPHNGSRIDARLTLPTHLQDISYARDIWRRLKSHPVPVPALARSNLTNDPEIRELLHAMFEASNEREKEVLLHNQARVFNEILGRIVSNASAFLSSPIVLRSWAINGATAPIATAGAAPNPPVSPWWKKTILFFLTPQYVLFMVVAVFGFAAGWSQLQNYQLRKAIDDFETASKASERTHKSLQEGKSENERLLNDREAKISDLQRSIGDLQFELKQSMERGGSFEKENIRIKEQLKQGNVAGTELEKKVGDMQKDIDEKKVKLESLQKERDDAVTARDKLVTANEELGRQYREIQTSKATFAGENASLLKFQQVYSFAESFIEHVRRQNARYTFDRASVKDALDVYDNAKRRILGP